MSIKGYGLGHNIRLITAPRQILLVLYSVYITTSNDPSFGKLAPLSTKLIFLSMPGHLRTKSEIMSIYLNKICITNAKASLLELLIS